MIRLFTTYYNETTDTRRQELLACISNNLNSKSIDHVYILNEGGDLTAYATHPKLHISTITHRPTYADFFAAINTQTTPTDINIIANTDIYFDSSIDIIREINLSGKCFALSRWDMISSGKTALYERADSQDCWIFRGRIATVFGDFCLGVPRCDNRIAYEIAAAGYAITNPAYSIKAYHLHQNHSSAEYSENNEINYIAKPYKYLPLRNLNNFAVSLFLRTFNKKKYRKYHFGDYQRRRLWTNRLFNRIKAISAVEKLNDTSR